MGNLTRSPTPSSIAIIACVAAISTWPAAESVRFTGERGCVGRGRRLGAHGRIMARGGRVRTGCGHDSGSPGRVDTRGRARIAAGDGWHGHRPRRVKRLRRAELDRYRSGGVSGCLSGDAGCRHGGHGCLDARRRCRCWCRVAARFDRTAACALAPQASQSFRRGAGPDSARRHHRPHRRRAPGGSLAHPILFPRTPPRRRQRRFSPGRRRLRPHPRRRRQPFGNCGSPATPVPCRGWRPRNWTDVSS